MEIIGKIRGREGVEHVDQQDMLPCSGALGNHIGDFRVECFDSILDDRFLGWNDSGHQNGGVGACLQDFVDQCFKTLRCASRIEGTVQIVGAGVQQDYIRPRWNPFRRSAGDLIDCIPIVTFVVVAWEMT